MKKIYVLILFLIFEIFFGFVIAEDIWVAKVNQDKISLSEMNKSYQGFVQMQMLLSPLPLTEEKIKQMVPIKTYFKTFINEHLILQKANEKKLIDRKNVDRQIDLMLSVLRKQIVVKKFMEKVIYPNVSVSNSEVEKAYSLELKKNPKLKNLPEYRVKEQIRQLQIKKKVEQEYFNYMEKLRMESKIISNDSVF